MTTSGTAMTNERLGMHKLFQSAPVSAHGHRRRQTVNKLPEVSDVSRCDGLDAASVVIIILATSIGAITIIIIMIMQLGLLRLRGSDNGL
jgi:hypothetical protein